MQAPVRLLYFVLMMSSAVAIALMLLMLHAGAAGAAEAPRALGVDPGVAQWAMIAAAIAVGVSTLAAGYAVATVGSAAVGALAEKPELLGGVLILVGLAEGIAIYGVIVAILILNHVS
jgi:V/A-type H+-transporting ATPase subunit K